jgi:hypothetical protein
MAEWGGVSDLYYIQYSELSMYGHPSFRSSAHFSDIDEQTRSINTNLNPSDREAGEILRSSIILMLLNLSGFYKFVRCKEAVAEIEDFTNRMVELSKGTKRLNLGTGEEK